MGAEEFSSRISARWKRNNTLKYPKFSVVAIDLFDIQGASELSFRLEDEFACLSGSNSHGVLFIDSGASTHMTGVRAYFSSYNEEHTRLRWKTKQSVLQWGEVPSIFRGSQEQVPTLRIGYELDFNILAIG